MITMNIWGTMDGYVWDYFMALLLTPFAIALDIILMPFEIVAFIMHRIMEGEWFD